MKCSTIAFELTQFANSTRLGFAKNHFFLQKTILHKATIFKNSLGVSIFIFRFSIFAGRSTVYVVSMYMPLGVLLKENNQHITPA